ncbi:hypothetical protein FRB91_005119 [Serendipita sp. 411]|nr:hypothetical protein FRB91_005119 [Serendipita sp. 411]
MPTQTGVKQDVEDGTCRNPHLYRSHSADSYTGILSIDKQLCVLVEIFTQLLDPIGFKFTQHFLWGLPAFIAIIHLEGVRPDAPWFVMPLALGFAYQLFTIGMVASILWIPFLFAHYRGRSTSPVPRRNAEGILIGLVIGYYIPTIAMLYTKSRRSIVLWQFFPVYVDSVESIWTLLRINARHSISSQSLLLFTLLTSTCVHLYTLIPIMELISASAIYEFLPAWHVPPGFSITRPVAVLGLLQYDAGTAYFATIVTGILLLDTIGQAMLWVLVSPLVVAVLGPSAYVAALWMKRERQLTMNQRRLKRPS